MDTPLRQDKHTLVGSTSIANAPQMPIFSKNTPPPSINNNTTTMPSEAYYARERRSDEAIEALRKDWYKNVSQAAVAFNLKPRALNDRWNGKASKSTREAPNKRLNEAQKQVVKDYIQRLDNMSMSIASKLVVDVANFLLQKHDPAISSVDSDWFKRFMSRNPNLKKRRQRPLAAIRKDVFNIEELKNYFKKLKNIRDEFDILDTNIWNMNETSFRIECERSRIVVTLNVTKNIRMTDSDNRDYITSIESVNAVDDTMSSLLILKRSHILHKWARDNDLNDETLLNTSDFEYSNDDLTMNWLHHFVKHTEKKRVEKWILLIIDDFESHMIFFFLKLIIVNNIKLFKLSSHFTHLTQSLNVGVFQSYKHNHDEAIDRAVRQDDVKFSRLNFLATFQNFRNETFKSQLIRHSFRRTNIASFDLSVVIDSMKSKRAARLTIMRSITSSSDSYDCLQRVTSRLTTRELRLWNRLRSSNNNKVLLRDKKRYQRCEERKNCYLVII